MSLGLVYPAKFVYFPRKNRLLLKNVFEICIFSSVNLSDFPRGAKICSRLVQPAMTLGTTGLCINVRQNFLLLLFS